MKVEANHVKSHQDDNISEEDLPREVQMNCICDGLANQCVRYLQGRTDRTIQGWSDAMKVMVKNREGYITTSIGEEIEE